MLERNALILSADPKNADKTISLLEDFEKVALTVEQAKQTELLIENWRATPKQALMWYAAQDPIQERDILMAYAAKSTGNRRFNNTLVGEALFKAGIYEKAAGTLIASVYMPEVFENGPDRWIEKAGDVYLKESPAQFVTEGDTGQHTYGIANVSFLRRKDVVLSHTDLCNLLAAAQMLELAADVARYYPPEPKPTTNELSRWQADSFISFDLYQEIIEKALEPERSIEDKMIGLDALAASLATTASDYNLAKVNALIRNDKKQLFLGMINAIAEVFLDQDKILYTQEKNKYRGKLHEMIWLLDALVFNECTQDPRYVVLPSREFQDRPEIGYPKHNRSFDFFLIDTSVQGTTKNYQFIQLKSRPNPQFSKEYHPLITVVCEQNFQDINPNRLRGKLNAYRRFFEADVPQDQMLQVKKYILPSVNEIFNSDDGPQNPFQAVDKLYEIGGAFEPIQLNRAERRALKKLVRQKKVTLN